MVTGIPWCPRLPFVFRCADNSEGKSFGSLNAHRYKTAKRSIHPDVGALDVFFIQDFKIHNIENKLEVNTLVTLVTMTISLKPTCNAGDVKNKINF